MTLPRPARLLDFAQIEKINTFRRLGSAAMELWGREASGHLISRRDIGLVQLKREMEYRWTQWCRSHTLRNYVILGQPSIHRFSCSIPTCDKYRGLKMTPSGIYCEAHYIALPSCFTDDCHEPCIEELDIKSIATENGFQIGQYCRLCNPDLKDFDYHEHSQAVSPIAFAREMTIERITSDVFF